MRADPVAKIADELSHFLWAKGYGRNCVNCDHWQDDKQLCGQFNALPPAKIIVVGCEKHTDLIPF